jgi:hypothetical protein
MWGGAGDRHSAEGILRAAGDFVKLDDVVDEAADLLKDSRIWAAIERVVAELRHFNGQLDHQTFVGAYNGFAPLR